MQKYQCKADQTKLLRVLTLGTALWSLQSLSAKDDGVKKTMSDFLARDSRLKNLFATEQAAFGNYLTTVILVTTLKDDQLGAKRDTYEAMSKSASIYENLGSTTEAFAPLTNLKK